MIFMKPKHTIFVFAMAAAVLPAAAFAQPNNELLPPPVVAGGQTAQVATPPTVQYLSEDQLDAAFEKALQTFGQESTIVAPQPDEPAQQTAETPGQVPTGTAQNDVPLQNPVYPKPAPIAALPAHAVSAEPVPIGQVRLNVSMENMPLEKVMSSVVKTVSDRTGKWDVRWRLKKENQRLLDERVNINAETDFENFMAYLMERVNNMTGVQLFVKVFEGSRLIIIADTY